MKKLLLLFMGAYFTLNYENASEVCAQPIADGFLIEVSSLRYNPEQVQAFSIKNKSGSEERIIVNREKVSGLNKAWVISDVFFGEDIYPNNRKEIIMTQDLSPGKTRHYKFTPYPKHIPPYYRKPIREELLGAYRFSIELVFKNCTIYSADYEVK